VRSQPRHCTLRGLDGSRDRRGRFVVLQTPVLGTAGGEHRNCPGIRSLLLQIPESSLSKAEARLSRRPLGSQIPLPTTHGLTDPPFSWLRDFVDSQSWMQVHIQVIPALKPHDDSAESDNLICNHQVVDETSILFHPVQCRLIHSAYRAHRFI
jgi:hypothetical protein